MNSAGVRDGGHSDKIGNAMGAEGMVPVLPYVLGVCAGAGLFIRAQTAIGAVLALAASIIVVASCRRLVLNASRTSTPLIQQ